jgi:hypothetical protein
VYQFIYSEFVSPVSQNNNGLSPKESKVALSSPEASNHYQTHQPSVSSIPQQHQQSPLSTAATPSIQQSSMMHMQQQQQQQQQQPQPQIMTVVALHPCN